MQAAYSVGWIIHVAHRDPRHTNATSSPKAGAGLGFRPLLQGSLADIGKREGVNLPNFQCLT